MCLLSIQFPKIPSIEKMSKNENQTNNSIDLFLNVFYHVITKYTKKKIKFKFCGEIVQRQIFYFLITEYRNRLK